MMRRYAVWALSSLWVLSLSSCYVRDKRAYRQHAESERQDTATILMTHKSDALIRQALERLIQADRETQDSLEVVIYQYTSDSLFVPIAKEVRVRHKQERQRLSEAGAVSEALERNEKRETIATDKEAVRYDEAGVIDREGKYLPRWGRIVFGVALLGMLSLGFLWAFRR